MHRGGEGVGDKADVSRSVVAEHGPKAKNEKGSLHDKPLRHDGTRLRLLQMKANDLRATFLSVAYQKPAIIARARNALKPLTRATSG